MTVASDPIRCFADAVVAEFFFERGLTLQVIERDILLPLRQKVDLDWWNSLARRGERSGQSYCEGKLTLGRHLQGSCSVVKERAD